MKDNKEQQLTELFELLDRHLPAGSSALHQWCKDISNTIIIDNDRVLYELFIRLRLAQFEYCHNVGETFETLDALSVDEKATHHPYLKMLQTAEQLAFHYCQQHYAEITKTINQYPKEIISAQAQSNEESTEPNIDPVIEQVLEKLATEFSGLLVKMAEQRPAAQLQTPNSTPVISHAPNDMQNLLNAISMTNAETKRYEGQKNQEPTKKDFSRFTQHLAKQWQPLLANAIAVPESAQPHVSKSPLQDPKAAESIAIFLDEKTVFLVPASYGPYLTEDLITQDKKYGINTEGVDELKGKMAVLDYRWLPTPEQAASGDLNVFLRAAPMSPFVKTGSKISGDITLDSFWAALGAIAAAIQPFLPAVASGLLAATGLDLLTGLISVPVAHYAQLKATRLLFEQKEGRPPTVAEDQEIIKHVERDTCIRTAIVVAYTIAAMLVRALLGPAAPLGPFVVGFFVGIVSAVMHASQEYSGPKPAKQILLECLIMTIQNTITAGWFFKSGGMPLWAQVPVVATVTAVVSSFAHRINEQVSEQSEKQRKKEQPEETPLLSDISPSESGASP